MLVSEGKSFSENPTAGLATDLLLLDAEEEAKLHGDLPSRLVDVPDDICPLVLTYRQFESMLDNSLPVPFLASMGYVEACQVSSLPEARASSIVAPCNDVSDAEADDENPCDWEGFSDEGSDSGDDFIGAGCSDATKSGRGVSPKTGLEVDYDRFEARYWPHLNAAARRGLDASLLWTEIQSCIKGGLDALDTARGQMDEVGYVALANRCARVSLAMQTGVQWCSWLCTLYWPWDPLTTILQIDKPYPLYCHCYGVLSLLRYRASWVQASQHNDND